MTAPGKQSGIAPGGVAVPGRLPLAPVPQSPSGRDKGETVSDVRFGHVRTGEPGVNIWSPCSDHTECWTGHSDPVISWSQCSRVNHVLF